MNRSDWLGFFVALTKSRLVLYGLIIGLLLLISFLINHLIKSPTMINMASLKPGTVQQIAPVESAEKLIKTTIILQPSTNYINPFYTDRFKLQQPPPSTNKPAPPEPPPPQFFTLNIRYMGMIQNSSGLKQAFFMVNSNLITATNSMTILTNITVGDFSAKRAILICPNGTNTLPFNVNCQIQLPIK